MALEPVDNAAEYTERETHCYVSRDDEQNLSARSNLLRRNVKELFQIERDQSPNGQAASPIKVKKKKRVLMISLSPRLSLRARYSAANFTCAIP